MATVFGVKEFGHCANCWGGSILYVKTTFLMALHSSTPVQITCFIEFIVMAPHMRALTRLQDRELTRSRRPGQLRWAELILILDAL